MNPESSDQAPATGEALPSRYSIEQWLTGLVMLLIVLITLLNVVIRYLTAHSFAATEELSIALLLVLSFLGSAVAFSAGRHIQVSFFVDWLPRRGRRVAEWLAFVVTVALFLFIAWYAARLTWDQYRFEETSPALGVPQWWYTAWMPLLSATLALRLCVDRWRARG